MPEQKRNALLVTALAPVIPHLLGSAFNIWYNMVVVDPMLRAEGLRPRFIQTVIIWNVLAYPAALAIWIGLMNSFRRPFHQLNRGETVPEEKLEQLRRRLVNLPWSGATISMVAWFLCLPAFVLALWFVNRSLSPQLVVHLPISFAISGFIATSQSFFLIELASQWGLFATFFRDARPDLLKGIHPISLRTRGLLWAVSAGICPIGSLLLLLFAPASSSTNTQWFGLFVGVVGIVFGLVSAVLIGNSVESPVNQLRAAAQSVTEGKLDVQVPMRRADEFGSLIGEFNRMVDGLREKERLRQTFGLHVGHKTAEQILARDPGLGGTEQVITVMFVDIRSFTARSAHLSPDKAVGLLNEFLKAMVEVVESEHGGMINKFLGDGFMALFGVDSQAGDHADKALAAGLGMREKLKTLNQERVARGEDSIGIGIGINTGTAIVGSIGSPDRMEFTVIGNTVNVASRIEALNKTVGTSLLLSKWTREALRRPPDLKALPAQPVKGVDEPVEIFTV